MVVEVEVVLLVMMHKVGVFLKTVFMVVVDMVEMEQL